MTTVGTAVPKIQLVPVCLPVVVNGKQREQTPARATRAGLQGLGDPESAPVRRRKARYVGAFAWLLKLFCG